MGDSVFSPPPPPDTDSGDTEALRLKALAETRFRSGSFKSALKYARRARRLRPSLDGVVALITALKVLRSSADDHYSALLLHPFAPLSAIKKQYRSLSLALRQEKPCPLPLPAAEDALKRVAAAFRFLSHRSRKRRFDLDLRLRIEAEKQIQGESVPVETFWTACGACRLLHEFDRRHVGQRLVCPRCRRVFLAVEVPPDSAASSANGNGNDNGSGNDNGNGDFTDGVTSTRVTGVRSQPRSRPKVPTCWGKIGEQKPKVSSPSPLDAKRDKGPKARKEKTLSEIQMLLVNCSLKGKKDERKDKWKDKSGQDDLSLIAVEDSDFYDFDKDRGERCLKKGQIWAIYDDDGGMPRHYGLVDNVLAYNPFRVKMKWLDVQNHGDETLLLWEKSGYHISCGRFKVGKEIEIDSVNLFSHMVQCEREAKDTYRIFPKKGSVWALYGEDTSKGEDGRQYDIAVFLTGYTEVYGMSMAYLEKVEGFKSIFKRKEIGSHVVKWLERVDARMFSHQIPSRKLSTSEYPGLPDDCWELDPASLPTDLLRINWDR